MTEILKKTFKDSVNGDILVRKSSETMGCGIVEMLHLWDKENASGGVVGFWEARLVDGSEWCAEFRVVHDRLADLPHDPVIVMDAIRFGQKLSNLVVNCMDI